MEGIYKHVNAPTMGIIDNTPTTLLPPEATPSCAGVYLKDGEVCSDFGTTNYPVPSGTTSNDLNGVFLKTYQFNKKDGTAYLVAFTTNCTYLYNTTTTTWDVIQRGNVIDDCESPWDANTGVISTADSVVWLRDQTSAKHLVLASVPAILYTLDDDAADTDVSDTGGDNHGTASVNTSVLNAGGVVDDAFNFERDDSHYVDITAATDNVITDTEGSITFWIRPESLPGPIHIFSISDASGSGILTMMIDGDGALRAWCDDGTDVLWDVQTADGCIAAGTWYHVCLVHNATTVKIYLDTEDEDLVWNVSDDKTAWLGAITGLDDGKLGCQSTGGAGPSHFYDGLIDEWRYYSEAITAHEVEGLYNNATGTGEVGGFTTGRMSSEDDVTTADISNAINTYVSFWVRCTNTVAADYLRLRISEQATGGVGATYADYTIPALVADTWLHVVVDIDDPVASDGGDYPDDFNAVASVALVAVGDVSGMTVYLDDIRTIKKFTGDEDNRMSVTVYDDTMVCTNGIDELLKYTGSGTLAALGVTLATGTISTSEVVFTLKDHLFALNNTENSADTPQRASWTNIGQLEDWVGGTAGYQDLVDDESWVVAVVRLNENEAIIYKEKSIVKVTWVGGATPFRFKTMIPEVGAAGLDTAISFRGRHLVLDIDTLYLYNGGTAIEDVSDKVRKTLFDNIDYTYINRSFLTFIERDDEVQLWFSSATTTPDTGLCFNIKKGNWYQKTRGISGNGLWQEAAVDTIGDLTGTIGEQDWSFGSSLVKANTVIDLVGDADGKVYKLDKTTFNNNGVAIANEFQTPDFVLPDTPDYLNRFMRVMQLFYEARGTSITTEWSSDGGSTWNPTMVGGSNTQALVSSHEYYQQDFDSNVRKVRFRFTNPTVSSGFYLRYYGFYYMLKSSRR